MCKLLLDTQSKQIAFMSLEKKLCTNVNRINVEIDSNSRMY